MKKNDIVKKDLQITTRDFLIYRDNNNDIKVNGLLFNNDIWLTQNLISELFGVGRSTIAEHINNILNSGELKEQVGKYLIKWPKNLDTKSMINLSKDKINYIYPILINL